MFSSRPDHQYFPHTNFNYNQLLDMCNLQIFKSERDGWLRPSVADPDPDPSDPYVFGPPGSGSVSQRYKAGSGSGPFYHQAKKVRKPLITTVY